MEYRDSFGVNKVLHGDLTLQLFNPLIEDPSAPFYSFELKVFILFLSIFGKKKITAQFLLGEDFLEGNYF